MRKNRQLFWGQGQFLTPQHFQQQDLFHQTERQYFWQQARPFGWGLSKLRIREDGLAANQFEILECEFVTRDGLVLRGGSEVDDPNAHIAPRNFQGLIDPAAGPVSVWVAVPRYQAGHANLATDGDVPARNAVPMRYRLMTSEQADLFDVDAPVVELKFVDQNMVLLFDSEEAFETADQSYELVKIAELVSAPGAVGAKLTTTYIPPCINIAASGVLFGRLKSLRDVLVTKGREFGELKRQRGVRATAAGAQDVFRTVMLQTLARYIPTLQHLLEIGRAHPEPVYAMLREMLGELSVFSEEITVLGALSAANDEIGLPAYDHERLWPCFDVAIGRIEGLIKALTSGPELGIRLIHDGEYFHARLSEDVFAGERTRYYLMIDSVMQGDDLWARLQRTGKIGAREEMQQLRQSALFGLKIKYLQVAPEELPQRGANYSYFQIDRETAQWKRIRESGNIAVFCDLRPDETIMRLMVVRAD